MNAVDPKSFRFPVMALLVLAAPNLVLSAANNLIGHFGYPFDHLALATVQNGHLEAAGRLRTLATWLLLAATGVGCLAYCLWSIRRFRRQTAGLLGSVYLGFAVLGVAAVALGGVPGGQRVVDERVICSAFALMEPGASAPPAARSSGADAGMRADSPPSLRSYGPPRPTMYDRSQTCPDNENFSLLWWLNEIQKYLLVLLIPALVIGTLSCLALPASPSPADCRYQVRRLNTHLYLTAMVLVVGLLFLSALLHWPGFAFDRATAASYNAHVDAYILYWGVAYTAFIGSYYVPVAALLGKRCEDLPAMPALDGDQSPDETGADPTVELTSLLKTLAALFAPTIAALLGGIIHL